MVECRFEIVLKFRNNALCQNLAEFDAPLIERINVPEHALCEDRVLVERHELAQCVRREPFSQDRVRRPIAFEDAGGTSQSGVPSAFTCSGVLPNASASV